MASVGEEALGDERRCIFTNYANGVDIEDMKVPFKRSAKEIEDEIHFVARKITEYRFKRCVDNSKFMAPPVTADSLLWIRINRLALFDTLNKLGNRTLSSVLELPPIGVQNVKTPMELAQIKGSHA